MELITFITIIKGIEYIITIIKIGGDWYHYMQISKKISYYEDTKMVYELSKKPKNIVSTYMGKFYKKVAVCVKELTIMRLEKRVERQNRDMIILTKARKDRDIRNSYKKEKELFNYGYLKDKLSQHYIRPDDLLQDIHKALVTKTPELKDVFDHLIIGDDVLSESDFDEIKKHLIYVRVLDRITGEAFVSAELDEVVYSPSSIIWLQAKVKKLYKVDTKVIEYENDMVTDYK